MNVDLRAEMLIYVLHLGHLVLQCIFLKYQIFQFQKGLADTKHHLGPMLCADFIEARLLQQGLRRLRCLGSC